MAVKFSIAVRNAMLDAIEATIGGEPILRIRTGAPPANCAAARTGVILASVNLPADWLSPASNGVKSKSGIWQAAASADGIAGHYEIIDSSGTTCHEQGTVTVSGGGGDMTVDNSAFTAGRNFTVLAFQKTAPNS